MSYIIITVKGIAADYSFIRWCMLHQDPVGLMMIYCGKWDDALVTKI